MACGPPHYLPLPSLCLSASPGSGSGSGGSGGSGSGSVDEGPCAELTSETVLTLTWDDASTYPSVYNATYGYWEFPTVADPDLPPGATVIFFLNPFSNYYVLGYDLYYPYSGCGGNFADDPQTCNPLHFVTYAHCMVERPGTDTYLYVDAL